MSLLNRFERPWMQSTKGKVILASLLGALALGGAWLTIRLSFDEMLHTVDHLSTPNTKMEVFYRLYREIILHDQNLRNQETLTRGSIKTDETAAGRMRLLVDTLKTLSEGHPEQEARLDSIQRLLSRRDRLYTVYLRARIDLMGNKTLSRHLSELNELLDTGLPLADSSVVTSSRKTTRTTIVPAIPVEPATQKEPERRPGFFQRLFGRKQTEPLEKPATPPVTVVEEEWNVQVDTVRVAREDSLLQAIGGQLRDVQAQQEKQTALVLRKKLEYLQASNQLIRQLMGVLHDFEEEEFQATLATSTKAAALVSRNIERMNAIIFFFFAGASLLVFMILTDIVRSNRYRKELIAAKEEAEHLGQVKERFLANMSHEIRTPLQTILGFADQAMQEEQPRKEAIEVIHRSSEHLLQIVNEVLDYSRLVSGRMSWASLPFDLAALFRETGEVFAFQAARKGLGFDLQQDLPQPLLVKGDAFRLRQVLFNIVGNALKFTEEGRVSVAAKAVITRDICRLTVQVHDTGIGMSEEAVGKVFRQFEQADTGVASRFGGTGLGLSIVRELVEGQGGQIILQSRPGEGTDVQVRLDFPLCTDAGDTAREDDVSADPALSARPGRILLIDDDPAILRLCANWLRRLGIDHLTTTRPEELLRWCTDPAVALVLADIRMPAMSGKQLLLQIRDATGGAMPVVAMTAEVMPEEQSSLLSAGFRGVLLKPFREKDIAGAIWRHARTIQTDAPATAPETGPEADERLSQLFAEETSADLCLLRAALEEGHADEIAEVLHRLAGRCGQFGHRSLYLSFRKAEIALRKGTEPGTLAPEIRDSMLALESLIQSPATDNAEDIAQSSSS